jgi:molybdopterin-guanine dinucleotide biosynthesis protein A
LGGDGLTAAILVGGQSRRMGTNKALLPIAPDGTTVVETVVQRLQAVVGEIVLVGMDGSDYAFLGLSWIADLVPGAGPLGGIQAALTATGSPHVLVVACDMPFLSVGLLRYMATCPRDYDVLVPVLGRPQPLHAIYACTCLPLIDQSLQAGQYAATSWFGRADVRTLGRAVIERYDPSLRSCFNMNTPKDLELARQLWAAEPDAETHLGQHR